MAFSIIMLACLIVCVGIDYLSLKRIDQNGALLGVTLPPDAAALPEVQSIVQQYLRWLRIICLLCAAGGVGLFFLPDSLLRVMVWVYFFFGSLALPYLPCLWANRTLRGKLAVAVNVIAIAAILLTGPVLGVLDHTPARLELQVSPTVELQSYHGKTRKYIIPLDSITKVQVYPSLPEAGRVGGIDLEHYWQGTFVMVHDGTVHLCLDPTAGKFLRVETEDGIFWLTAETDEQTEKVADWLTEELS